MNGPNWASENRMGSVDSFPLQQTWRSTHLCWKFQTKWIYRRDLYSHHIMKKCIDSLGHALLFLMLSVFSRFFQVKVRNAENLNRTVSMSYTELYHFCTCRLGSKILLRRSNALWMAFSRLQNGFSVSSTWKYNRLLKFHFWTGRERKSSITIDTTRCCNAKTQNVYFHFQHQRLFRAHIPSWK